MAADHQRLNVIDVLLAAGTPIDAEAEAAPLTTRRGLILPRRGIRRQRTLIRGAPNSVQEGRFMAGEISFFSIGVGDADKAREFYGALFGWGFADPPAGAGAVIQTSNVPGGIHGGDPGASPYLFFGVVDIEAAATRVHELGGQIDEQDGEDDPLSVERFGRFRLCRDDQGSPFGLHQAPSASPTDSDDGKHAELVAIVDEWAQAIVSNDAERIAGFTTDDWVIVSESGMSSKEGFLSFVESGELTHSAMARLGEARVRVHGDTAVLTTRMTNTAHYGGRRFDADEWTTDVFVRRDGRWLCALSHITSASLPDGVPSEDSRRSQATPT